MISTKVHIFSPEIKKQITQLSVLNNYSGILALCKVILSIFILVYTTELSIYIVLLVIIIIACIQRMLTSLLHEASHGNLAKNRILNTLLGHIIGYSVFYDISTYRKSHLLGHHKNLFNIEKDPDFAQYQLFQGDIEKPHRFFSKLFTFQYNWDYLKHLYIMRFFKERFNQKMIYTIVVQLSIFILLYSMKGWSGYFIYWIVPYVMIFPIVGILSELSEHFGLEGGGDDISFTRNRNPNWIEKLLIGNFGDNYHLVHHLFPSIPFWNLKHAHQILMQDREYAGTLTANAGGIFSASNQQKAFIYTI